jgi:hypothetical protein
MIARSKDNLRLLLTLGYSPNWLGKSVAKTWLPVYSAIILAALLVTQGLHLLFLQFSFVNRAHLSPVLHWSVWLTAFVLLTSTVLLNSRLVKKELREIGG